MEFMRADSDFGELFIIENQTVVDGWNVLYIEKGIYFKPDSNRIYCAENNYSTWGQQNGECYMYKEFQPTKLKIRQYSQKSFPNTLFETLLFNQLEHFEIANIGINEFHRNGLLGADSLKLLNLSHNALERIPSKLFENALCLTEIDLSHNQIVSIPSDVFQVEIPTTIATTTKNTTPYSHNLPPPSTRPRRKPKPTTMLPLTNAFKELKTIRLNNNNLTFIDSEWFSNLKNLATLTLNDNFLTQINAATQFGSTITLRTLHLQNNNISIVTMNDLHGNLFEQLESFDISNNPILNKTIKINAKTINITNTNSRQCFIPINATILRANHNQIDSIVVEQLPNINLRELYLNHNKINSIEFLFNLNHLQVIDLSYNELTEINATIFARIFNLTALNISHNKLKNIDFIFLVSTTQLIHLDVSNNFFSGLFKLDQEAIALTELNISNNNFTSVQQNLRKYAPQLRRIDLNGNYLDCDELTSLLLFMYFDLICPIYPYEEIAESENNVRGIKCHRAKDNLVNNSSTKTGYELAKEQLRKPKTKLIDLFHQMMTSKTVDN